MIDAEAIADMATCAEAPVGRSHAVITHSFLDLRLSPAEYAAKHFGAVQWAATKRQELAMPSGVNFSALKVGPKFSVRVINDYDIEGDTEVVRVDILTHPAPQGAY